jgi:hypothetical protein
MASLTPAPRPAVQQPSAAQRTATQRSAAAAAAELVLVSAASGRAYIYGEGGGLPISESASLAASACHLPGREDLIAAVQRAYGDAFSSAGQAQAGLCGTTGSAGVWGAAQLSAAAAVADAISSHVRWMLASLYVAALPPLLVERGTALRSTESGGRGGSLVAPLFHRPSPPDAESAARADLLAHLPSAKQLQRTVLSTTPFWRRFTETQILHQHHQMRAGRAFSAAFRGAEPVLLSDSSSVIEAAIEAAARRVAAAAAALSPPPLLVAPSPVP